MTWDSECGQSSLTRVRRVVGGEKSPAGLFPWIAAFIDNAGYNFCAGALVKSNYVVTAAHCFIDKLGQDIIAIINEDDLNKGFERKRHVFKVKSIFIHPHFIASKWHHDIALVEVSAIRPSIGRRSLEPICLPSVASMHFHHLLVAGWGLTNDTNNSTKPDHLHHVDLPQVDQTYCEAIWSENKLTSHQICAGSQGRDTCIYDSGAPLMSRNGSSYTLAGVTSFGSKKCGDPLRPGVYTRVSSYLPWIDALTRSSGQCWPALLTSATCILSTQRHD